MIERGKRLFTRDGRRVGNAIVIGPVEGGSDPRTKSLWKLETDFGNKMTMDKKEIAELYHVDFEPEIGPNDHTLEIWMADRKRLAEAGYHPGGFTWIFREAEVRGEDFTYRAVVLCSFPKRNGKVRYIVEDNGRIFIQRIEQITFVGDEVRPTTLDTHTLRDPRKVITRSEAMSPAYAMPYHPEKSVSDLTHFKYAFKAWRDELVFDERLPDGTPKLGKFEAEELYRRGSKFFGIKD